MSTGGRRTMMLMVSAQQARDVRDAEIATFFARYRNQIRWFLIGACGCPEHEADDVVQDTIMVIRDKYWERVRDLQKPCAYWYKITDRRFRRTQGQQARERPYYDPHEHLRDLADPADPMAAVDLSLAGMDVFRQLPLRQRQVLWLREAAGFSTNETAEILAIDAGTVKSHLYDAKAKLKMLLRKDGATGEADKR